MNQTLNVRHGLETPVNCSYTPHFRAIAPAWRTSVVTVLTCGALWTVAPQPLLAQAPSTPALSAASDGTNTTINFDGKTYHIEGGTQAGNNLFHSFEAFGLDTGEVANFLSHPDVSNIFGRVTGGTPSVIDGLIQVRGANSNLYLMNPAGLVFGPNASLNVMGDFTATTATGIEFQDGILTAFDRPDYAQLVGSPQGFVFESSTHGSIVNQGTLTSQAGKDLALVGETVVNTGEIKATDGQITLAAVPGTHRVKLSQPGMLLSLEVETTPTKSELTPLDLPQLLTGAGVPEQFKVEVGDVVTTGEITGKDVTLMATGRVKPSDPTRVRTHNGAHNAPTVVLLPEAPKDAIAYTAIDSRADNALDLLYGGTSGTISTLITPEESGIGAIAAQVTALNHAGYELDAVNIVAEGNAGNFWLGSDWLTSATLGNYQAEFAAIGDALTTQADLLLYSCFTALGLSGEAFIAQIADLTGADVAASVNATGSANYGADWQLEHRTGEIEAVNPFATETLVNWDGKLAMRTVTSLADAGSGTLRDALGAGVGFGGILMAGDTVNFSLSGTINLGSEILWTADNVTIDGSGQSIVVDGGGSDRLFNIDANNATIRSLTVKNGAVGGMNSGGGILHQGAGLLQLENTTVSENTAYRGGGIFSQGFTTVLNSTIARNSASDRGGGLVTIQNAIVTNSTIEANLAGDRGGGIRSLGNVIVSNSTIANNRSGEHGGGIFGDSLVGLTTSTVTGNRASQDGGGIYSQGTVNLTQSTLSGNSAFGGGGLHTAGGGTLANTTISGNAVFHNGGGIQSNGVLTLTNVTIAGNLANIDSSGGGEGGGIFISGNHNHRIENSIIASNRVLSGTVLDIAANLGSSTVQNNLIQTTTGITGLALSNGVNGNIIGQDPLLGPLANNGGPTQTHTLQPGSPALDAGNNGVAASTDQRGQARISNGTIDLGAVEVQVPSPTTTPAPPPPTSPAPTDFTPTQAIASLETSESVEFMPVVLGDRLEQLLASDQLCAAIEASDRHHTQAFRQHFGQFALEAPLSCDDMQRQLPEEALLVSVFASTDQLHLVTLTAAGEPSHHSIPVPRETVLAELTDFQRSLTNPILRKSDQFLGPAQQLYQWIVAPLLPQLQDQSIQNILFTLGDGLRTLPLAALHDGEQFLIESYQASLIPSLSLTPTHRPKLQDAAVLAVGISEFAQLNPLPAVPVEIASIKAQFPKVMSFQNEQATFAAFEKQLHNQPNQIVHLSTHGSFQPGQAADSYIQFWDQPLNFEKVQDVDWSQSAVELLVLSACQTALGDASVEYGFAGLAVQAQAGAAVAGLWGANDTATLALMREFYRQLRLGQPKGEALRQAQLALLQGAVRLENEQLVGAGQPIALPSELQTLGDRAFWHPYYWSAFTLIGNPW